MNCLKRYVYRLSDKARARRAELFNKHFDISEDTKILDLGSESGDNIVKVLEGCNYSANNIYVADIVKDQVLKAHKVYGFNPVVINAEGELPFPDGYFDIVYCSSVLEHVTVDKKFVWSIVSGKEFKRKASKNQLIFSNEIKRIGKQYFVQTPNKNFLIESHSWLPLASHLPRFILIRLLKFTNSFWIKKTTPDWHLLTPQELQSLFEDSRIECEKYLAITKSIIAIKSAKNKN
ncbi:MULTISPECIES: methyltransferase domain-containing protein [Pseudoalteromonas]|uniref:methyltransferase domain-containing protein n=1 Tax=Pseudoalteromonas TaxID=53246 RepID=UPI000C374C79|nr:MULTISPECIES: methyltransferase domain-containing protein [Pseudoalteromonas]MAY60021.1 SAM-dependent methyltransferase [Pseudoalteromonas sp.]MDN3404863.1 methyltransferase domain-containing protein [Pseudoalteromonas sp. APC 3218]MDN3407794.1 methyltransferase domain-containing protein [Pseudoalteromonas sp. APC 3894]MDN3415434.1 methyltransferase domain-containing protein [Pseudoalteromonas sp. APC 3227]MDN3419106.1 methyltransferase domain-containing protein [Pseudoalteromonas sp. APC 3